MAGPRVLHSSSYTLPAAPSVLTNPLHLVSLALHHPYNSTHHLPDAALPPPPPHLLHTLVEAMCPIARLYSPLDGHPCLRTSLPTSPSDPSHSLGVHPRARGP